MAESLMPSGQRLFMLRAYKKSFRVCVSGESTACFSGKFFTNLSPVGRYKIKYKMKPKYL